MTSSRRVDYLSASVAALLLTASCGRNTSQSNTTPVAPAQALPIPTTTSTGNPSKADFRAAAEPFETLTETAFTATPATLDAAVAKAKSAALNVRSSLPPASTVRLDAHLAALDAAHGKKDRTALAISSIEVYRDLVTASPNTAKTPTQVSLLDYAGFRYNADLSASPARWDDMKQAVAFANDNWALLTPKVGDPQLTSKFTRAIGEMEKAAALKSRPAAAAAAKAELDLVDQLEKHFLMH